MLRLIRGMLCVALSVGFTGALLNGATLAQPVSFETLQEPDPTAARPNIVFIFADDMGWTDVNVYSPHEQDFYHTPNMNRLAEEGMMFTQAYSNASNCAPARAALMSGQYYPRQPVYTVGTPRRGRAEERGLEPPDNQEELPLDRVTFADLMRDVGYTNAYIGKWHLGPPPTHGPLARGFHINVGGTATGNPGPFGGYFSPWNYLANPYLPQVADGTYLTDVLVDEAVRFIEADHEDPFFLYLSTYVPHTPVVAPEELVEFFEDRQPVEGHDDPTYAAMVKAFDLAVGRVLEALEEQGLADDTLVIVSSDQGPFGGYDDIGLDMHNYTSAAPLRAGKGTFYEGGLRVPFLVRWPDVVPAGTVNETPILLFDLYPTFVDLAGASIPKDYVIDGRNITELLTDPQAELDRQTMYWHFPGYLQATGPSRGFRSRPVSVVREGDWKLLKFYEDRRLELYNLAEDLGERNNLAESRPEQREQLYQRLQGWLEGMNAPMPEPKP